MIAIQAILGYFQTSQTLSMRGVLTTLNSKIRAAIVITSTAFLATELLQEVDSNALFYPTLFGKSLFNFIFNGSEVFNIKPSKTEAINKTIISCWDLKECYVEFLRAHFVQKIPSSLSLGNIGR